MKHKLFKRITSLLASMVMMLTMIPTKVFGETTTSVIDMTKTGTLTLTKTDVNGNPIKDVEYTIYKIADIIQGKITIEDDEFDVGVNYDSLMEELDGDGNPKELPVPNAIDNDGNINSELNQQAEELYNKISNKDKLINDLNKVGVNPIQTTDVNGKVTFDKLPLGIYLVYESKELAGTEQGQSFIVSIPMTVQPKFDTAGNIINPNDALKVWNYDIEAQPKNDVTEPTVDKSILVDKGQTDSTGKVNVSPTDDTTSKAEDYQIGDSVPYQIKADVPADVKELKYFFIKDTLSPGLTYNQDAVVYAIKKDGSKKTLVSNTDYKIERGIDNSFTVYFRTGALNECSNVYVEYSATLNTNANVGTQPGNTNNVTLNYSHTTSTGFEDIPNIPGDKDEIDTVDPDNDPIVYTHALTLTKINESNEKLSGVEFELRDNNGNKISVVGSNGEYTISPNGTAVITTGSNGIVAIKGLNDGQYQLVETKTASGYTLLKEPIIVNIKSILTTPDYPQDSDGEYFKIDAKSEGSTEVAKYYARNAKNEIVEINLKGFTIGEYVRFEGKVYLDDKCTTEVPTRYIRNTQSKGIAIESNYEINRGTGAITLTVVNKKGFNLPQTGGMGTYVFTIGGLLMVVASVVMFIFSKKKTA